MRAPWPRHLPFLTRTDCRGAGLIEGVIAALKHWMGFDRVRYVGLVKNSSSKAQLYGSTRVTRSLAFSPEITQPHARMMKPH
jgi:hypothetical protein